MQLQSPLVNDPQMEKILSTNAWDAGAATRSSATGFNGGYTGCRYFQNYIEFMSAILLCDFL